MAARIVETDFGTKKGARQALDNIVKYSGKKIAWFMFNYWTAVYFYALQECPVDTHALQASIRISRSSVMTRGDFVVGLAFEGSDRFDYYITAGGNGVINPKHGREVDYAEAVHDGYTDRAGNFHMGNPFLERAIEMAEADFDQNTEGYYQWVEEEWGKGALTAMPPLPYNVPVMVTGGT